MSRESRLLSKRADRFIENDMTRDENTTSDEVKTMVPTMMIMVAKKETMDRSRCQFMWGGGGDVKVTETPKGMR